jgi:Resolvase, N terminal domain
MANDRKPTRTSRCAIYTRVSTDSGLEQDFNSLDNQREASEAYIKCQAHEGCKLVREHYDDGGYSGGSMDRPALRRLLDDVPAKRVDIIVVYKVDRLTRSLADFAKLVELFDAHGVIVQPAASNDPRLDRAMRPRARTTFIGAFSDAHRWLDELVANPSISIAGLAAREHKSDRSIRLILSLAFLSPDLAKCALEGSLLRGFKRARLVDLPMLWADQWQSIGLRRPSC